MANNINTPEFRGAFVQLFKARGMAGQPDSTPKFSIKAVFAPGTDLSLLKSEAQAAADEMWGAGKTPKLARSPFRKNGDFENPVPGYPDDAIVMTFSANEDKRPGVVDAQVQDIVDESQCYSGAYYRANVRAFAYDTAGNKGISFGLQNVQKLRDGEPLGGRVPANKAFDAVAAPAGASAATMFD